MEILTPVSRDNYRCIKSIAQSSYWRQKKPINARTREILHQLYRRLHASRAAATHSIRHASVSSEPIDVVSNEWFTYIPQPIQREIATMKHHYTHTFSMHERTIRVRFLLKRPSLAFRREAMRKMGQWLNYVLPNAPKRCAQTIDLYLIPTGQTKRLPSKVNTLFSGGTHTEHPAVLSEIHANTAFTTACPNNCEMFIYRQEDWFKVFIHETFHALGLDFAEMNVSKSNADIRAAFPAVDRNTDVRLYESYSEMWAEIINVLLLCGAPKAPHTLKHKKIQSLRLRHHSMSGFRSVAELLHYEQIYSLYQAHKVLRHYRLRYSDLFSQKPGKVYREKTNTFSYFIAKSILMWHLDEFIEWCVSHNERTNDQGISLRFDKTQVSSYVELVNHLAKTSSYQTVMGEMESNTGAQIDSCNTVLPDTLRMCLLEGRNT